MRPAGPWGWLLALWHWLMRPAGSQILGHAPPFEPAEIPRDYHLADGRADTRGWIAATAESARWLAPRAWPGIADRPRQAQLLAAAQWALEQGWRWPPQHNNPAGTKLWRAGAIGRFGDGSTAFSSLSSGLLATLETIELPRYAAARSSLTPEAAARATDAAGWDGPGYADSWLAIYRELLAAEAQP